MDNKDDLDDDYNERHSNSLQTESDCYGDRHQAFPHDVTESENGLQMDREFTEHNDLTDVPVFDAFGEVVRRKKNRKGHLRVTLSTKFLAVCVFFYNDDVMVLVCLLSFSLCGVNELQQLFLALVSLIMNLHLFSETILTRRTLMK